MTATPLNTSSRPTTGSSLNTSLSNKKSVRKVLIRNQTAKDLNSHI